jgi:hypothetical protein
LTGEETVMPKLADPAPPTPTGKAPPRPRPGRASVETADEPRGFEGVEGQPGGEDRDRAEDPAEGWRDPNDPNSDPNSDVERGA